MDSDGRQVVLQGTWRYADEVVSDVRILLAHLRPGTGDAGDDPEWREDQPGTFFVIEYGSPGERGRYRSSVGYFALLAEAVADAEAATHGTLTWEAQPGVDIGGGSPDAEERSGHS